MIATLAISAPAAAAHSIAGQVHHAVNRTHLLQHRLIRPATPYHGHTRFHTRVVWRRHVRHLEQLWTPWPSTWLAAALCVHRHEGSWSDPNPTYYGGMQADRSFASTYGTEFYVALGTPDHWLPHQQLLMAWRGWQARGWTPWPETAAFCGLL